MDETQYNSIKDDLREIKTDVKETNGRVRKLESWRWFITGGLALISIIIVPIILFLIEKSF